MSFDILEDYRRSTFLFSGLYKPSKKSNPVMCSDQSEGELG